MEEDIMKTLEYQINVPTAHDFLVCFLRVAHADKRTKQLSSYILDGTLLSYSLNQYLPSQLAAAAVFIAGRTIGRKSWSPTLLRYTNYCDEEIAPVARAVLEEKTRFSTELFQGDRLDAVLKKYTSTRYGAVANTVLVSDF
jgi:hypothetical protein